MLATGGVLDNVAELERIAKEELVPLVERARAGRRRPRLGAWVGIEFVTDKRSIRPAPAFHAAVHQALLRRGVLAHHAVGQVDVPACSRR